MFIGINIGALAVKVACLDGEQVSWRVVHHQGQPVQTLQAVLKDFPKGGSYGVCGYLGHLSESAATEAAIRFVGGDFDAVASLGGETFAVYLLAGGRIFTTLSHNQCAAGSGEFLVQQIGRLGLTLDDAIPRSFDGKVVPLASRCSVHCKSDITHKLNRKEASVEDILRTLRVVGQGDGPERLRACWERHVERQGSTELTKHDLAALIDDVASIQHTRPDVRKRRVLRAPGLPPPGGRTRATGAHQPALPTIAPQRAANVNERTEML